MSILLKDRKGLKIKTGWFEDFLGPKPGKLDFFFKLKSLQDLFGNLTNRNPYSNSNLTLTLTLTLRPKFEIWDLFGLTF